MTPNIIAKHLASLDEIDFSAVLSDLDGVVYRGADAVPGAAAQFQHWQARGVPYCFVTNNAEKAPAEFAAKIENLGIACTPDQVVTSAEVALAYATGKYPRGSRVYAVGSPSLKARLEDTGFVLAETDTSFVLVALDRQFNYAMMTAALRNVLGGAELIGTNPDLIRPAENGFEPGTGAILQSIALSAGVTPRIMGKPSPDILRIALARLGTTPDQAIMLGDQIETDIMAAHNAGIRSVLVQTGVPAKSTGAVRPDYIMQALQ